MQHFWVLLYGLPCPSSTGRHRGASSTGRLCCLPAHVSPQTIWQLSSCSLSKHCKPRVFVRHSLIWREAHGGRSR